MMLKPSDAYTAQFTTHHPDTGIPTNADSLPTASATHNGTDDPTFTLTITNMATGRYKIAGTIPVTYQPGDIIQILTTATVNSITSTAIVDQFTIDTKRASDLVDFDPATQTINVGQWAGIDVIATDFSVLSNLDVQVSTRSTFDSTTDSVIADVSAVTDWSDTEKQQIRHRLGIDGDSHIPTTTGDLSDIKTILQAATRK